MGLLKALKMIDGSEGQEALGDSRRFADNCGIIWLIGTSTDGKSGKARQSSSSGCVLTCEVECGLEVGWDFTSNGMRKKGGGIFESTVFRLRRPQLSLATACH